MIIVDHLGSFPSIFEPLTGGGLLLVSAAEGFFFLSGLLVGRIRGHDVRSGNSKKANHWLIHRAAVLYVVSVVLTLGFTILARHFNYFPRVTLGVSHDSWLIIVWRTLTLQYSFGLADMLPLYTVYLLASIGVLWLLKRNRWVMVLLLSFGLWFVAYIVAEPIRPVGTYFSLLSWQLPFFGGLVLGYYNNQVQTWWSGLNHRLRVKILSGLLVLAAVGITVSWVLRLVGGLYENYEIFLEKQFGTIQLGPGRVLLFAICMIVAYHGVRHYEARVNRWIGWFFVPLGQNSLFVYSLHSILVFYFIGNPVKNFWVASLLDAVMLAIVFGITKLYQRLPSKHKYL